ncbi:MAG: type I secretion system permease/ATPase [Rhizobiaceae bacterium]
MQKSTVAKVARDFRRTMWVMGGFSFVTNLLLLAIPLYMLQIYDRVLPSQSNDTLLFLSLIAIFALLVLALLEVVRSMLANRAAARFDAGLSELAMRTVIRQGAASGGNVQPMRDLAALRNLLSSKLVFGVLDLPFAWIFIAILYFIHPALFWLTLAGAAVLAMLAMLNQFAIGAASRQQADKAIQSGQRADFLARSADSLIAMGMVSDVLDNWGSVHADGLVAGDRAARINAWFAAVSRFLRLGLQIAILGYGAGLVLAGEMTPGMIFASSLISGRGLQPIDQIIGSWRQLLAGWQSWKRLSGSLTNADRREAYTALPTPAGKIGAEGIFVPNPSDPTKAPILHRVSFMLQPGESVAVLGPSGSGKSTLARLLVGAMQPRAGHVRLDGHDLANWDPEVLGKHIGYLAQDVELIPGTIAQNIARFDPNASDEEINKAARLAHVEDLIQRMPQGYDTLIGPGGLQVSGGEKQRIGLARAFFGDPRILVLDEPNSSLDRIGEMALMKALVGAKKSGITTFIITQREMVLAAVDKILRMQNGMITDFDNRDVVIAKYRQESARASGKPEKVN